MSANSTDSALVTVKGVGILVEFLAGLVAFVPLLLRNRPSSPATLFAFVDALAGGVFLSISLCHMGKDATEELAGEYPEFPMSLFMLGCGYLTIFLLEHALFPTILRVVRPPETEWRQLNLGLADDGKEDDTATGIALQMAGEVEAPARAPASGADNIPAYMRTTNLYAFTVVAVICTHEFFEGLALGIQDEIASAVVSLVALGVHKGIEAFAVGAALANSTLQRKVIIGLTLFYTCVAPLGVAVGLGISEDTAEGAEEASAFIAGFSAGTFFYIAVIMLRESYGHRSWLWSKAALTLGGFAIMSILTLWA